jgi:hypothetical protein
MKEMEASMLAKHVIILKSFVLFSVLSIKMKIAARELPLVSSP